MIMDVMTTNYQSIRNGANDDLKKAKNKSESTAETSNGTTAPVNNTTSISETNEAKLSSKAQKYLENLRSKYGDYDFMIGNSTDDLKSLAKSGTKEFSVIFSNAELERMANDEKYAQEKMQGVAGAVRMSEQINQQFGFQRAFGKNGTSGIGINKLSIAYHEDGTTTFFAELEKSSAKQRERIEKNREERLAEKKELQDYTRSNSDTKRTMVQANSMDELYERIAALDWTSIKAEPSQQSGGNIDVSV